MVGMAAVIASVVVIVGRKFEGRLRPSIEAMNAHLRSLILGLPAMGVPASFYARFADALGAATGADVEFADLPGQGERPERARDGADFGYREIVEEDLPDWVARRRAEHPGRPILLLGHSLGGQLALLPSATLLLGSTASC